MALLLPPASPPSHPAQSRRGAQVKTSDARQEAEVFPVPARKQPLLCWKALLAWTPLMPPPSAYSKYLRRQPRHGLWVLSCSEELARREDLHRSHLPCCHARPAVHS